MGVKAYLCWFSEEIPFTMHGVGGDSDHFFQLLYLAHVRILRLIWFKFSGIGIECEG